MYSTFHITCVQWNKRRHCNCMPDVDRACHGSQKRWAMALHGSDEEKVEGRIAALVFGCSERLTAVLSFWLGIPFYT